MNLVLIPKGTFMMGSHESEQGRNENENQHDVTIRKDYYLGVYEVTQAQYEKVMGKNPSHFQGAIVGNENAGLPVEQVSSDDAVEFCKKLSDLSKEKKVGRVYRLPIEAEWEYACRAGSKAAYSFGANSKTLPSGKIQIDRRCMSMEEFLDDYIERHGASRKPATVAVWKQVVANLREFMPEGIRINQITDGHAKEYHEKLKARGMATTTIHKRIQFARQFMHDAVDWTISDENPFCKVKTQKSSVKVNEFAPREVVDKQMKKANLRSEMTRLLPRAGVSGWPRLFHSVNFETGGPADRRNSGGSSRCMWFVLGLGARHGSLTRVNWPGGVRGRTSRKAVWF
jgi:hypothetical protein